ncbi:MAG TPA: hypothetical protein VFV64_00670 [Permianibacter sp.]|nr:hypothetical protein [Permianibacter sp.]
MTLTTLNIALLLLAQAVVALALTIGLVALAMRGSRRLQERMLSHSRALSRFGRYVLSDSFQQANQDKARDVVLRELAAQRDEQERSLAERESALQAALAAFELQQAEWLKQQASGNVTHVIGSSDDDPELAQLEQTLQDAHNVEQSSALLSEIAELRANLDLQNSELARLRAQVSQQEGGEQVQQLLEAQRKQLEQYQRMQRDMDMCVMVMEQELSQTRQTLQKAVQKLRQQTALTRQLQDQLTRGAA